MNIPKTIRRIILAYKQGGFLETGGIKRLAYETVLRLAKSHSAVQIFTLSNSEKGVLAGTQQCIKLHSNDHLILFGCDVHWGYQLALKARLKGIPVAWLPCFHDPQYAHHPLKARTAQIALRSIQFLGVTIYALTTHEAKLLRRWISRKNCRISGHGLPQSLQQKLISTDSNQNSWTSSISNEIDNKARSIDLLFLGRPTPQKGWPIFKQLAENSELRCEAIVPFAPQDGNPKTIELHIHPNDREVAMLLQKSKIVAIPANYESFGIAQVEAVLSGCVVPILGHWPIWDNFKVISFENCHSEDILDFCKDICQNEILRLKTHRHQLSFLRSHPIVNASFLPGFIE